MAKNADALLKIPSEVPSGKDVSFLGVFDVGERIAAQIVLRFPPCAISNQVTPNNP